MDAAHLTGRSFNSKLLFKKFLNLHTSDILCCFLIIFYLFTMNIMVVTSTYKASLVSNDEQSAIKL